MCGIFGIIAGRGSRFTPRLLESTANHLFRLSESRGKEASGLAFFYRNTIQVYKQPLPATSLIRRREYKEIFNTLSKGSSSVHRVLEFPVTMIGHSRLVTNGTEEAYRNNQPVIKSGIVGIHNGIITNNEELWERFPQLKRESQIDTEVLLDLVRLFYKEKGSLAEAVKTAYGYIEGAASISLLFKDSDQLLLATNCGSLYVCSNRAGNSFIFASEKYILKELTRERSLRNLLGEYRISHVQAGEGCLINSGDLAKEFFSLVDEGCCSRIVAAKTDSINNIVELVAGKKKEGRVTADINIHVSSGFMKEFDRNQAAINSLRRCRKCVLPETMTFIEFDDEGVCNYCRSYNKLEFKSNEALEKIVADHRSAAGDIDCIVGLSGGRDSCYALHYIKAVLKMNPVAYTYDWGMVTDLARRNQSRMCGKLGVEHVIISADIGLKRRNIRKNVTAWLNKPDLGTVPLFMAGDKQFFWFGHQLKRQTGSQLVFLNENRMETTYFKTGFCGIHPKLTGKDYIHTIGQLNKLKLVSYYGKAFLTNPSYINTSILDTLYAYACYYIIPHDYYSLFDYIVWKEEEINETLIKEYNWEVAADTRTTWRIGDGTAPFYNYIYYTVAGFSENDTLRSNQIREGHLTREYALKLVLEDNKPRCDSLIWYANTVGFDLNEALKIINAVPKLYRPQ